MAKTTVELLEEANRRGIIIDSIDYDSGIDFCIAPLSLIRSKNLSSIDKETLMYLMSYNWINKHTHKTKGFVFLSTGLMMEQLGLSARTAQDRLLSLSSKGLIYRISNNSNLDYSLCVKYVNEKYNIFVENVSLTYIDLFQIMTTNEIIHYLKINEDQFDVLMEARTGFICELTQLEELDEDALAVRLDKIFYEYLKYSETYLSDRLVKRDWDTSYREKRTSKSTGGAENCRPIKGSNLGGLAENCIPSNEGLAENCRPNKVNNLNEVNNKNNVDASHQRYHSSKQNYFSNLNGVKKDDIDKPLSYKESKALESKKREESRKKKMEEQQTAFRNKFDSKLFSSFTNEEMILYYEQKLKEVYGNTQSISQTAKAKYKASLEMVLPGLGLKTDEFIKVVDSFIKDYRNLKGVDCETYPIPKFPQILLANNGAFVKQIMSMPGFGGENFTAGNKVNPNVYREDEQRRQESEDRAITRESIENDWAKRWNLTKGNPDRNYMQYIRWIDFKMFEKMGIEDIHPYLIHFFVKGYITQHDRDILGSRNVLQVDEFIIQTIIPAYKDYVESMKQVTKGV